MLELHKMIRMSDVVVCPIVFISFYGRSREGRVFKIMKNDHILVFLAVWVLSPTFFGR